MPPTKSKSKYSRTDPSVIASSVFEVDTSGSAAIRHSVLHGAFASRARKGVQRTLRVDQILSETASHGPPPVAGRVRGATRDVAKAKFLTATEKKRLEQMVIRRKHDSGINSIDPVKRNGTAVAVKPPQAPEQDIWTAPPSKPTTPTITTKTVTPIKPPSSLKPNETLTEVVNSVPASGLMPIPLPHPGQSYNPALSDHQAILRQTLEKLEEEQQEVDRALEVKQRVNKGLKLTQAKSPWEICEEAVGDGESDGEQPNPAEGSSPKATKKKIPKKKTKAQRRRQEKERELMRMHILRKEAKRVAHTLHELPKLVRGLTVAEREARQARMERKAKRAALVAEYGLRAVRGGKPKGLQSVEDRHEYQLTEDLTESGLRGLKPEGNLWRDWAQSNTRRGKLDSRPKIGLVKGQRFQKGRMFKEVEKHAWKNFEA
ncbi:hypothetical protein PTTG_05234 [Puccinia triticina 1-1 BBBD Race 1]|uniref:Ribosome biogenesis protein NOP53 n=2 Tax=Puccinia triticina TaxID=208348 RepID=A0A180GRK8_PUCT1|nr:uncharacterized protein PtA15_16A33 [Puccinia triticina]OAV95019.1 hypothetical protein PTTG_05234 [Puccinia triticina 1-1 BBBD Race 1]WAQ92128.1 hypothetical protein PtA15_16A33 [Puccinia triticina]WAR63875.1 hypothetical protein PtB15_16B34 [Puccinia triticina]